MLPELQDRCLVIGRILNTRWVASSLRTVVAVWKQFEALHNHVSQAAADDTRTKRERAQYGGLMTKLRTDEFANMQLKHRQQLKIKVSKISV